MGARIRVLRVITSSLTLAVLSTALIVAAALAGDIQPPVPR
jgi:hypothetical protein